MQQWPDSDEHPKEDVDRSNSHEPLAVFPVGGHHNLGLHTFGLFNKTCHQAFRQCIFVSVAVLDFALLESGVEAQGGFKATENVKRLRKKTRIELDPYLDGQRR